ncbi:hypothetical protein [Nocardioides sp.]|uniref:hypothetical protein n=1 Tax=Nocardioides sp. TaxID=35761 RepID=UPI00286B94EE|nr:hypothetical protein [Nocardioides sp.]
MKSTSSLLAASLVVGLGGAVAAYRATTDDLATLGAPTTVAGAVATPVRPQVVRPGTRFRWAPCAAGTTLEQGVCVRDVVRTVVVPAPAPAPAPAAAPVPGSSGGRGSDDGASDSEDDDRDDDRDEDDADDEDDDRDDD